MLSCLTLQTSYSPWLHQRTGIVSKHVLSTMWRIRITSVMLSIVPSTVWRCASRAKRHISVLKIHNCRLSYSWNNTNSAVRATNSVHATTYRPDSAFSSNFTVFVEACSNSAWKPRGASRFDAFLDTDWPNHIEKFFSLGKSAKRSRLVLRMPSYITEESQGRT